MSGVLSKAKTDSHRALRQAFGVETSRLTAIRQGKVQIELQKVKDQLDRLSDYNGKEGLFWPALMARYDTLVTDYNDALAQASAAAKNTALEAVKTAARAEASAIASEVTVFLMTWDLVMTRRAKSNFIIAIADKQAPPAPTGRGKPPPKGKAAKAGPDLSYLLPAAKQLAQAVAVLESEKTKDCKTAAEDFKVAYDKAMRPGGSDVEPESPVGRYVMEQVAPPLDKAAQDAAKADPAGLEARSIALFGRQISAKMADMKMLADVNGVDVSKLNPAAAVAIREYTTGAFTSINEALLGISKAPPAQIKTTLELAEIVKGAMAQLDEYAEFPTNRGENPFPGSDKQYKKGNTFALKLFWSTGCGFSFPGTLQIRVIGKPKGSAGKSVSAFSRFPNEKEVLFPTGTKFRVVSAAADKSGTTHIVVKEV